MNRRPGTSLISRFACCGLAAPAAFASPPILYSQPAYESPVQGQPDDLLMLGGYGLAQSDTVIYQALGRTTRRLTAPSDVPARATADVGRAPVVSSNNTPYSLTIRLPETMRPRQSYALWVRTASGEFSNPIEINDLRPLWLSPAFVYATAELAGLPRYLKLVGRNMDVDPSRLRFTRIKLSGPQTLEATAEYSNAVLDSFVARVRLPSTLLPGHYHVAATRDGSSWIELHDQLLEVRPDPAPETEFAVSDARFGGCRPDDGQDDTACVVKAIDAAKTAGRGTVTFGRGTWNLTDSAAPGVVPGDGIVVPSAVNLRGTGPESTRLVRDARWNAAAPTATFTLRGDTTIQGFTFADTQMYVPADRMGPFLQVGENSAQLWARTHTAPAVHDLVITHNRFDHTDIAIGDGGLAMERVFITYNEFGSYRYQLELGGNWSNMTSSFRIDDAVIAHNVFKPGSFLQIQHALGPIASEIGASHRMDFSDNIADGAATDALYSSKDARGWRAGFFFHMNNDQEMLLVSGNTATCTGDKIGDGEAIALDNSGNTFAFLATRPVVAAEPSSVTVLGPLAARQVNVDIPLDTYYVGHWIQVGDGPGRGQVRKITGYDHDAAGRVTFRIAPQWDVVPVAGITRISVGREFWQTFIIGNHIDHRKPACQKSNRSRSAGGSIALWAQLADSVVAGNEQFDTDGLVFHEAYTAPLAACPGCGSETFFQSFLEIRDNLIRGKYDSASDCKASGISGGVSAAPGESPPPTLGFGVTISHNRIEGAGNAVGGAITVGQDWHDGPAPHQWPILDNLIVQHNQIERGSEPVAARRCADAEPRRGISFPGSRLTWRAVLYANSCAEGNSLPNVGGQEIVRVCPSPSANSCECAAPAATP